MTAHDAAVSTLLRAARAALEHASIPTDRPLIVGFSGGPDSLALLWCLHRLAKVGIGPPPLPVHVDHGLHAQSSELARRAVELGHQLGLAVIVRAVDVPSWPEFREGGTEAGARAARYAALAAVAHEHGSHWIAVGHTRDDQAETVLLRLLRGAGLDGLAAMRLVTTLSVPLEPTHQHLVTIRLVRPLLKVRREVIRRALRTLGLQPLEDPTNASLMYERNRIRHQVIPVLEEVHPSATEALAQVAEQLQEDADTLRSLAGEAFRRVAQRVDEFVLLDRHRFAALSPALQRRVLQLALVDHLPGIARERLLALRQGILRGQPGTKIELGLGYAALVSYTEAILGPHARIEDYLRRRSGRPLLRPGTVIPIRSDMTVELENGWTLRVERAPDTGWFLRTRRPGDRYRRPESKQPIRLQDWLVNRKEPAYFRDWLPLVASDGVVWWIAGLEGSSYVSPDGTLSLRLTRGEEGSAVNEAAVPPVGELERVLIDEETLQRRIAELGEEIARAYAGKRPVLVGVLTGAFVFMADLIRHLPIDLDIDFMAVSSYGQATVTSGVVRIIKDLDRPIEGRDVILVEDIVDSGLTLQYLLDVLQRRNPQSLRVVVLLRKQKPDAIPVPVDWVGFDIPDEFVVGYGLDAAGRYRNLPFVAVYRTKRPPNNSG